MKPNPDLFFERSHGVTGDVLAKEEDEALKAMWRYTLKDVFFSDSSSGEGGMSHYFFLKYLERKFSSVVFLFLDAGSEYSITED